MTQFVYYAGPEHHREHLSFIHQVAGGDFFIRGTNRADANTYANIEHLDSPDTVWFFADLYRNILPHLRGKAVFVPHGLGFKPFVPGNATRSQLLDQHVDQIWSTGYTDEAQYAFSHTLRRKVERIGYTLLFQIPELPADAASVYVSVGWFQELASWEYMLELLRSVPEDITAYVSLHPSMPAEIKARFSELMDNRHNLITIRNQRELLRAFSVAGRAIVGLSSVAAPYFYFGKPVIFVKDRNRFPLFQWQRLRFGTIRDPMFYKILSESARLLVPAPFDREVVMTAKPSRQARHMFYETNWDRDQTKTLIRKALSKLVH